MHSHVSRESSFWELKFLCPEIPVFKYFPQKFTEDYTIAGPAGFGFCVEKSGLDWQNVAFWYWAPEGSWELNSKGLFRHPEFEAVEVMRWIFFYIVFHVVRVSVSYHSILLSGFSLRQVLSSNFSNHGIFWNLSTSLLIKVVGIWTCWVAYGIANQCLGATLCDLVFKRCSHFVFIWITPKQGIPLKGRRALHIVWSTSKTCMNVILKEEHIYGLKSLFFQETDSSYIMLSGATSNVKWSTTPWLTIPWAHFHWGKIYFYSSSNQIDACIMLTYTNFFSRRFTVQILQNDVKLLRCQIIQPRISPSDYKMHCSMFWCSFP